MRRGEFRGLIEINSPMTHNQPLREAGMRRVLAMTLMMTAAMAGMASAQHRVRQDEYIKATGFAVEIKPGSNDEGWEHITDAMVTITHASAAAAAKPMSLPETIVKFTMLDENNNRAAIEVGPCRNNALQICLYLRSMELPKTSDSWLKNLLQANGVEHRDIVITVQKGSGEKRTFNLIDTFPQSFSYVDIAAEGNAGAVMRWTLEVRVQRIEMA